MKIPLFDIDGTLVKTASQINQDVFVYAVEKVYGIKTHHQEINPEGMVDNQILVEILKLHGLTENQVREKIDEEIKAVTDYAKEQEKNIQLDILPGVTQLLETLKNQGIPMGVLTGNVEGLAWVKLDKTGLKEFFKFGAFGDKTFKRVELVEHARQNAEKTFGKEFKTQDFVIVGDTPKDIECARAAGIKAIIVSTGKFSYEDLQKLNPDLLIHSLEEKEKILSFLSS